MLKRSVLLIALVLGVWTAAWAAFSPPKIIEMPWGYILISNNEVSIISTVDDPPKLRLGATSSNSLGAISFGKVRPDGVEEEAILIQGKLDERYRDDPRNLSGEITIHLRNHKLPDTDDAQFVKVLELRADDRILTTRDLPELR